MIRQIGCVIRSQNTCDHNNFLFSDSHENISSSNVGSDNLILEILCKHSLCGQMAGPAFGYDDNRMCLGVSDDATLSEITSAYRALVCRFHPDKYEDQSDSGMQWATTHFQRIQVAYEALKIPSVNLADEATWTGEHCKGTRKKQAVGHGVLS